MSGPAVAAAPRIPPTVVSSTGSEVSAGQYDVATVVIAASPVALSIDAPGVLEQAGKPRQVQRPVRT
jgi:hypothetical protein